jgi:hypothetical protein
MKLDRVSGYRELRTLELIYEIRKVNPTAFFLTEEETFEVLRNKTLPKSMKAYFSARLEALNPSLALV